MKERTEKKPRLQFYVSLFVLLSLLLSIVFVTVRLVLAPAHPVNLEGERGKSDYMLMLLQCVLGVVVMALPGLLTRRLHIEIPSGMMLLYVIFLYCAIYLGEVRSFYYQFSFWDSILHWFSGAMLGALGFSFIVLLNKADRVPMNLSPLFVAIFAFCFAVTLGVVWEFYEYTFDGLLGLNMQKFALSSGEPLVGRAALNDTMKDLFVDAVGAAITSILGFISLKHKKGWIEKFMIRRKRGVSAAEPDETRADGENEEG